MTPEAIEAWLVDGDIVTTNLPDDGRFVRMYPQEEGRWYWIVFESEEWEELVEGEEIPVLDIEVRGNPISLKVDK